MTDPLRTDKGPAAAETERDRDARVEELLLAGLDHYFAGQHDLAINVWTRVLFLDRGHARARAYIERARSAISERQREGDELFHTGADAFNRGDATAARQLLTSALERGAASDEALALLQRLDRLETASAQPDRAARPQPAGTNPGAAVSTSADNAGSHVVWVISGVITGVLIAAGGGAYLWSRGDLWLTLDRTPVSSVVPRPEPPLPLPAASEVSVARARTLYEKGRLHEALRMLDAVRLGDAVRPEADDLRARIQQDLLAAARGALPSQPDSSGRR
jgi:hypothetical protein